MNKQQIIIASSNAGKLREFEALFADLPYQFIPQSELNIEDAEENGNTFLENALIKARHAAQQSGSPSIADDSGLVVEALNGDPGIYSARYAGTPKSDRANNEKLLQALKNIPAEKRHAYFHCCLVLVRSADDPQPMIASANWHGKILIEPRGTHGFGYDPIFYVPTHELSAAEITNEIKSEISHRAQALKILKEKMGSNS